MLRMDESEGAVEVLAPESLSGLSPRGLNATALQWETEEGRGTERRPSGRSVDVSEGSGRAGRRGARPRESHAGRQGSLSKVGEEEVVEEDEAKHILSGQRAAGSPLEEKKMNGAAGRGAGQGQKQYPSVDLRAVPNARSSSARWLEL